jgi:hypothetical protein
MWKSYSSGTVIFFLSVLPAYVTKADDTVVSFMCNAPKGHVCQFGVRAGSATSNFGLRSGETHQMSGLVPKQDKYCVCEPIPATINCVAPDGAWCSGWRDVEAGINQQNNKNSNALHSTLLNLGDFIPTGLPIPLHIGGVDLGLKDYCITGCGGSGNVSIKAANVYQAGLAAAGICNGSFGQINGGHC